MSAHKNPAGQKVHLLTLQALCGLDILSTQSASLLAGSQTVNVEPSPTLLDTVIEPP